MQDKYRFEYEAGEYKIVIVVCDNPKCGKFYNGAALTECPYCHSKKRRSPTKEEADFRGIKDSQLPTCHGGVTR